MTTTTTRSTTRSSPANRWARRIDTDFQPDVRLDDGDVAAKGGGWTLRAVYTPGHTSNHMCYALEQERRLFTGDHVMGWSTTIVSPPDGDMRAYIESLRKVMARSDASLWPTHGAPVTTPQAVPRGVPRSSSGTRSSGARRPCDPVSTDIDAMVKELYADVREELHKAAAAAV